MRNSVKNIKFCISHIGCLKNDVTWFFAEICEQKGYNFFRFLIAYFQKKKSLKNCESFILHAGVKMTKRKFFHWTEIFSVFWLYPRGVLEDNWSDLRNDQILFRTGAEPSFRRWDLLIDYVKLFSRSTHWYPPLTQHETLNEFTFLIWNAVLKFVLKKKFDHLPSQMNYFGTPYAYAVQWVLMFYLFFFWYDDSKIKKMENTIQRWKINENALIIFLKRKLKFVHSILWLVCNFKNICFVVCSSFI